MKPANVHIILSHPFSADNIGAAARAIKNMGFSKLRLVAPRRNWRKRAAILACNAKDILDQTEVFPNLQEATSDLNWTVGTTCRTGSRRGKFISFDRFIENAREKTSALKVGIVFGREDKGLNNAELDYCDKLVSLPSDEHYPSLNLAQSVMVTVFSLARERLGRASQSGAFEGKADILLDKAGIQSALRILEEALECVGFYKGKAGRLDPIMKMTEALFKRAGMYQYESQMIKGVSARVIQKMTERK